MCKFDWWEAVVEIEESEATTGAMKEQLLFWSGGQDRIDNADGDIEKAYLKMLGSHMIFESIGMNIEGVKTLLMMKKAGVQFVVKMGLILFLLMSGSFQKMRLISLNNEQSPNNSQCNQAILC